MTEEKLPYQVQADVAPNKSATLDNPATPSEQPMSQQAAVARRNALVKELFRIAPKVHPPRPFVQNVPKSSTEVITKQEAPADKAVDQLNEVEVEEKLHMINGVHLDLFDYFSIDSNTRDTESLKKLQYVNSWVASDKTFDKGLQRLHEADMKLGSSDSGETKLIKLYNWLRFSGGK